jgi:NAD(P)-dependent dehydrogenase (short-subunit alcohol dehydrogenase family)
MRQPFRYDGKRVIVTGAYSGMGAETVKMLADAGAEIHALDVKDVTGPVKQFLRTDMGDPAAIDRAVEKIGGPMHCLFNCAGIPQTFPPLAVMKVNFLGLRHLTERVLPLMPEGASVAHVASLAGSGWQGHLELIKELLATPDFGAGLQWCGEHVADLGDGYFFAKECVIVYTMLRSRSSIRSGVRMNCISPGPVDSPMMVDFRKVIGSKTLEWTAAEANGRMGRSEEMAPPLVFLNSDEASYVNGHNLIVDAGFTASLLMGEVDYSGLA